MPFDCAYADTVAMARSMYPNIKNHKLDTIAKHYSLEDFHHHRACDDARELALILVKMIDQLRESEHIDNFADVNGILRGADPRKLPTYHQIIIAKTQRGLKNLYELVSQAHVTYYKKRPRVPKSLLIKHREGLIVGSACEAGELFQAVLANEPWEKLKEIASWYDYLEIQPIGNNYFMVREGRIPDEEGLRDLNRIIVKLGDELGIPVVATGDVHFLDPHHAKNRAIIQAGMGFEDADNQAPLYFKTTDEMLEEFSYLGPEKCHEVVIDNPKKIADMVEKLQLFPIHPKGEDTFQPLWEDAADNIQNMTWGRAKEMYGEELPEIVVARIEKELKSIIGYGFSTLEMISSREIF